MDNSLVEPLRAIFEHQPASASLSEYELIRLLQGQGVIASDYADSNLALFQMHFRLFNALYQLQGQWQAEAAYLWVSPLSISLVRTGGVQQRIADGDDIPSGISNDVSEGVSAELSDAMDQPLRHFYLDWAYYHQATEESVDKLLGRFWGKFLAQDGRSAALAELSLTEPVIYAEIKRQYRRLAMEAHPDRGGDKERLQQLNGAMETLDAYYK